MDRWQSSCFIGTESGGERASMKNIVCLPFLFSCSPS